VPARRATPLRRIERQGANQADDLAAGEGEIDPGKSDERVAIATGAIARNR
jgi:hypothetical protein